MRRQQRPQPPTRDATGCVSVVGALRATAATAGISAGQPALATLDATFFTHPGRAMSRNLSSQHHRAPTSTVKTP